jgi:hypothetical protein
MTTLKYPYCLAFTTLREEWFIKLDAGFYILTDKADQWLDAQQKRFYQGKLVHAGQKYLPWG